MAPATCADSTVSRTASTLASLLSQPAWVGWTAW